jgi:hypothetical protein
VRQNFFAWPSAEAPLTHQTDPYDTKTSTDLKNIKMSDKGDHDEGAEPPVILHSHRGMPKDAIWKDALAQAAAEASASSNKTPAKHATDANKADDGDDEDSVQEEDIKDSDAPSDDAASEIADNDCATMLDTYFNFMDNKWNGALCYGNLDKEKKWEALVTKNGYVLEMRTFAEYRELITLTDELRDRLRELAEQEVGEELKVGTEEFRFRLV